MSVINLPGCFQASQASFGIAYSERIETMRGGAEEIFSDGPGRWKASFVIEASQDAISAWRAFLMRLGGAKGLVYVHDVSDAVPFGGARTATALAAAAQSSVSWVSAGAAVAWEDDEPDAVSWDLLPSAPAVTILRIAEAAATGADSIEVEGLWPSLPGVIRAGEYIQIGHWLYTATHTAISGPNGRATVAVTPDLRSAAAKHGSVKLEQAATVMRLDQSSINWSRAARAKRWPLTVSFSEVMPAEGVPD